MQCLTLYPDTTVLLRGPTLYRQVSLVCALFQDGRSCAVAPHFGSLRRLFTCALCLSDVLRARYFCNCDSALVAGYVQLFRVWVASVYRSVPDLYVFLDTTTWQDDAAPAFWPFCACATLVIVTLLLFSMRGWGSLYGIFSIISSDHTSGGTLTYFFCSEGFLDHKMV